jgi:hypothetical protein
LVGGPKQNEQDEEAGHVPRVNDLLLPLFARLPVTTNAGLVEERKVSKKFIEEVRTALRCYVFGECSLEDAPEGCMEVYGECAIDEDWNEK